MSRIFIVNDEPIDNDNFSALGLLLHLISALALSLFITKKYFPNLHGGYRFGICLAIIIVFLVLSVLPFIGVLICIANAAAWIIMSWSLIGKVPVTWLMWTLRAIAILFITAFELSWLSSFHFH